MAEIQRRPVLAFAGIGDPDKFFATLSVAGIDVKARMPFPDHHRFSRSEALALAERARRDGLLPVTTEKDMARLDGRCRCRGAGRLRRGRCRCALWWPRSARSGICLLRRR